MKHLLEFSMCLALLAPLAMVAENSAPTAVLSAPGDAGASVPDLAASATATTTAAALPTAAEFPLRQTVTNHVLGGGVRGFGLQAWYDAPGPKKVLLQRLTTVPATEPYLPITLAKVYAPDGRLIAVHEFTEQTESTAEQVLTLPDGPAGLWRVSFSGGRQFDRFTIGLLATTAWGVRGEMSLNVSDTVPDKTFLTVPATAKKLLVEQFGGTAGQIKVCDETGQALGETGLNPACGKRLVCLLDPAPAGQVLMLDLTAARNLALLVEGAPGLLCPTAAAARQLQGGTVTGGGFLTAGPLQARIRNWMAAQKPDAYAVDVKLPTELPADLPEPLSEAQLFARYGSLIGLQNFLGRQSLNPADPWCGTDFVPAPDSPVRLSWETFQYGGVLAPFQGGGMAAVAATPAKLNPYYRQPGLARRTALSAFYHLSSMSGENLIREGSLCASTNSYPMTHAFFVYEGALASAFALLQDQLDPETRELWREGLLAVGDKIADFQAYESNQWAHVILGHLYTYKGTGEKRFLGYFERLATAYLDNSWGPNSKFGQHPAGFFLEEYGADGNYDNMNLTAVAKMYYACRELKEINPQVVEKLRRGIEKNLAFKSFHWLPPPGGHVMSPTAFNSRRAESSLAASNPAGDYLAHREFDLGLARVQLTPMPPSGTYPASVFPYMAVTDEWARRLIQEGLKPGTFDNKNWFGGAGMAEFFQVYRLPATAKPAILPIAAVSGRWELPGQIAWKQGALYGVVFHDVAGASPKAVLRGVQGGGPTALWTAGTGPAVVSMATPNPSGRAEKPDEVTFSGVFGEDAAGKFFHSGKERSQLVWIQPEKEFEIRADLAPPVNGRLVWNYTIEPDSVLIRVRLEGAGLKNAMINLPLLATGKTETITQPQPGNVVYAVKTAGLAFTAPTGSALHLTPALPCAGGNAQVRGLRLPLPADGTPVQIQITPVTLPTP